MRRTGSALEMIWRQSQQLQMTNVVQAARHRNLLTKRISPVICALSQVARITGWTKPGETYLKPSTSFNVPSQNIGSATLCEHRRVHSGDAASHLGRQALNAVEATFRSAFDVPSMVVNRSASLTMPH